MSDQTNVSGIENLVEIGELRFAAAPNVTNDFSSERKLAPESCHRRKTATAAYGNIFISSVTCRSPQAAFWKFRFKVLPLVGDHSSRPALLPWSLPVTSARFPVARIAWVGLPGSRRSRRPAKFPRLTAASQSPRVPGKLKAVNVFVSLAAQ